MTADPWFGLAMIAAPFVCFAYVGFAKWVGRFLARVGSRYPNDTRSLDRTAATTAAFGRISQPQKAGE